MTTAIIIIIIRVIREGSVLNREWSLCSVNLGRQNPRVWLEGSKMS